MPLSKTDIQNVRNAYYKLSRLDPELAKAEACGIDCDEIKRRRDKAMKDLSLMNEVYGNEYPESQQ